MVTPWCLLGDAPRRRTLHTCYSSSPRITDLCIDYTWLFLFSHLIENTAAASPKGWLPNTRGAGSLKGLGLGPNSLFFLRKVPYYVKCPRSISDAVVISPCQILYMLRKGASLLPYLSSLAYDMLDYPLRKGPR